MRINQNFIIFAPIFFMMIKRIAAIFFILLANIIILAHAMLPHHQHKGEIFLVNSHHESSCDSHEHSEKPDTSDHESDHDVQCCELVHDFIIPSNQIKQERKLYDDAFNYHGAAVFQAILGDRILTGLTQFEFFSNPPPLITSADSLFKNRVFGLRAPPIV